MQPSKVGISSPSANEVTEAQKSYNVPWLVGDRAEPDSSRLVEPGSCALTASLCKPASQLPVPYTGSPQELGWVGASPGRTLRNSLFHTVSLMSAWWRPGLKEMGLNVLSKGRACWSSALEATVCIDGGAASPIHKSSQTVTAQETALKMAIISSPPPPSRRTCLLPGRGNSLY